MLNAEEKLEAPLYPTGGTRDGQAHTGDFGLASRCTGKGVPKSCLGIITIHVLIRKQYRIRLASIFPC
jgi:hypothetical protein